jgi:hypothetical protein
MPASGAMRCALLSLPLRSWSWLLLDGAVPTGLHVCTYGLVRCSPSAAALPAAPRVAGLRSLPFCTGGGAEAETRLE